MSSSAVENPDESTPDPPGAGKRLLPIGVGVLVLGLLVQLVVSQTALGGPILLLGVACVIPLVAAVWAVKRRATSVWSPVLYAMAGGTAQLLAILIPLVITSALYPDPRHPIATTFFFGTVATCLSALLGMVVGGVVIAICHRMRSRGVEPEASTF